MNEPIIILLVMSVALNLLLVWLWHKETEEHIQTLAMSSAMIKALSKRCESLREELKGGDQDA